jgi:hypothetical protein
MILPATEWRDITADEAALRQVWEWRQRDKTLQQVVTLEEVSGPAWAHYGLYVNGELRFGVSVEEHRPGGYEVHTNAAPGCSPRVVREASRLMMAALMESAEDVRIVAWNDVRNRAGVIFAKHFLIPEIEIETPHGTLRRYGINREQWEQRNGQRSRRRKRHQAAV